MHLAKFLAASTLSLIVALPPAARADDQADVKVTPNKKELLTDTAPKPVVKPETQPDEKPEKKTPQAKISPDAKAELDQLTRAYQSLTSLQVEGVLTSERLVAGEVQTDRATFAGQFTAPNKFHHEMVGDRIVGSTGKTLFAYCPDKNEYKSVDAPKDRVALDALPSPMRDLLRTQNLGLLCAVVDDAGKLLATDAKEINKASDVILDGKPFTALDVKRPGISFRLLIDPQTHLIRQVVEDWKHQINSDGNPNVTKALMTFEYTTVQPQAKIDDKQFAWSAPEGAKDAALADAEEGEALALVGKDAPDFTLNDIDGKPVSMKDQMGSVIVLDFWATWCGPCRESLPGLNKLYVELRGKGFKAFAIDLEETKDVVQPVKAQLIPDLPVLLDEKSEVAGKYAVSPIPQTVVIGKDGKIKKVFIGSGNEAKIRQAVDAALSE
jgi:peroxiredoxin